MGLSSGRDCYVMRDVFLEPTQYEYPQEEPRSIQSSSPDYTIDYAALDYNQEESKMDDYDAFDYVNGDFDKVVKGSNNNKDTSKTFPPKDKGIIYSSPSLVLPQPRCFASSDIAKLCTTLSVRPTLAFIFLFELMNRD